MGITISTPTHRKWSWADEDGFTRKFHLPLAELQSNVAGYEDTGWTKQGMVLDVGAAGKFDEDYTYAPCVIRGGGTGLFYMFYTGTQVAHNGEIGVAYASAPDGTWTRMNGGDPIIEIADCAGTTSIYAPQVVYDEDAAKPYQMIWMATDGANKEFWYSQCATPDGAWDAPTEIAEFAGTNRYIGSSFWKMGKLWMGLITEDAAGGDFDLWYSEHPDEHWTKIADDVLAKGAGGTWESSYVAYTDVAYINGVLYAFYSGSDAVNLRIGMASSTDLGLTWTKFARNPVVTLGAAAQPDDGHAFSPSVMQYNDTYYMWYSGDDGAGERVIMLATIP